MSAWGDYVRRLEERIAELERELRATLLLNEGADNEITRLLRREKVLRDACELAGEEFGRLRWAWDRHDNRHRRVIELRDAMLAALKAADAAGEEE